MLAKEAGYLWMVKKHTIHTEIHMKKAQIVPNG